MSLLTSFVIVLLLVVASASASAYAVCTTSIRSFQRYYDTDISCGYVNVPIKLSDKSASTKISTQSALNLESYVAAWRGDGSLIDAKEHTGDSGKSSAAIIWVVATPTHTLHTGTVNEAPNTVPGCKGHHGCQYQ